MLSAGVRRVYLDACVFLSYINEYPQRANTIEAVLRRAAAGPSTYTSVLSGVEVAFAATEQAQKRSTMTPTWRFEGNPLLQVADLIALQYSDAHWRRTAAL